MISPELNGTELIDLNPLVEASSDEPASTSYQKPELAERITRVFDHYHSTIGKSAAYILTPQRLSQGRKRFAEAMTMAKALNPALGNDELPTAAERLMCYVVDMLAESDYHMARGKYDGQTKYNDWDILFRSAEQFQKFAEREA